MDRMNHTGLGSWLAAVVFLLLATTLARAASPAVSADFCLPCHLSNGVAFLMDGKDVSPIATWEPSMMSLAARDPYWRAKVAAEVAERPGLRGMIESECLTCHAPLGTLQARANGGAYSTGELDNDPLGREGASCIACHGIQDVAQGKREGMTGHYTIPEDPQMYGPYPDPFVGPMVVHTGLEPAFSGHISESALCATCHNLYTPALDADNKVVGRYPEQVPFSEWIVSDYAVNGQTCQSCHMESVPIHTAVSTMPPWLEARTPVWTHMAVGGNTRMLELMDRHRDVIDVPETEALRAAVHKTRDLLQNRAVELRLTHRIIGDSLEVAVELRNLAGHKFPTAYPERRAWIHLALSDSRGNVIFESGRADAEGRLRPDRNDTFEPHHDVIRRQDSVQIFEVVPSDVAGNRTRRLLSAAANLKDNRLPPVGFDPGRHQLGADCPVVGMAESDPNFSAADGSDTVRYRIPTPSALPVSADGALYYQSVPPAVLDDLARFTEPEVRAFLAQAGDGAASAPELIVKASLTITPD